VMVPTDSCFLEQSREGNSCQGRGAQNLIYLSDSGEDVDRSCPSQVSEGGTEQASWLLVGHPQGTEWRK
jgi:hypothetical protein